MKPTKRTISIALFIVLTTGIFILDLLMPLGTAVWLLYLLPLIIASRELPRAYIYAFAAILTVFIAAGYVYSPPGIQPDIALFNRFLAVGVVWTAAILLFQRRRAEEKISFQASIVESSDDAIIGKTLDGIILNWNPGAQRLYGYSADEITGKPVSILAPPDRSDEIPQLLERLRKGQHIEHFETVRVRKDGKRIDVSLTISPIQDATGKVTAASTIARDITERKQMEENLRRQQEAIRELSTPVLQVRERMLILPIIGVIDSFRALQLTEQLLRAIRGNRARVVVMDITGVPAVDSKVANHLVQTIDASRLMGATVVITGLSPEIAQTLVTLGVDTSKMNTAGDLQGGIEAAEKLLGYKIIKRGPVTEAVG